MNKALIAVFGFLAVVALLFVFAPSALTTSSNYDHYLCSHCGIEKFEEIGRIGPVRYHHKVTFEETAISRVMRLGGCSHNWVHRRFDFRFKGPRGGGSGQGGSRSIMLHYLIRDDEFAKEVMRTESPSKHWNALVLMLDSNRTFDEEFGVWWNDPDRGSFANWADTNLPSDSLRR